MEFTLIGAGSLCGWKDGREMKIWMQRRRNGRLKI